MANRELPTPERLRQILDYDPSTGALTWLHRPLEMFNGDVRHWRRWNTRFAGKRAFAGKSSGYHYGSIDNVTYSAHRMIWAWVHGEWPPQDLHIDHANGDRADNRLANLRLVTPTQNNRNKRISSNNTTGVTGVVYRPKEGAWQASIYLKGGQVSLGYFKTKTEAAEARAAANKAYGFTERHGM